MTSETRKQEIWKVYPDYPFIEASSLGRIRTVDHYITCKNGSKKLIKGHMLNQYLLPRGYMYVTFGLNGKTVNLRVHRVVATSHLPNPDNLPEVNHKDNDHTNNILENLEWCTSQYNNDYKKNFGTSPADIQGRPVYAIDLETGKVLKFESQSEAARQLGVNQGHVNAVLRGEQIQTGGYWFTEDESKITEEKIQEVKDKMHFFGGVIAINTNTFDVFYFESQSKAARQLQVYVGNLNKVLNGRLNKTGSCWFCYADKSAVEETREKFGDDMAKKVEKLMNERKTI